MGTLLRTQGVGRCMFRATLGGALIAGGLLGALVTAPAGGVTGRSLDRVTVLSAAEWPPSGGSAASGIDAALVATSVDPAVVDITSTVTGGVAAGTGMVITPGGQVLTNNHVVDGATRITGQIDGAGRTYTMSIIGVDPAHDVALLQLEGASNLRTVSVGDSTKVGVGDPVLAIGNGLGRGGTPSTAAGTVVALGQTITATEDDGSNPETLNDMIETNADIQPGYSGGPLVNARGQVIGMDTAASQDQPGEHSGSTSPDGFAIPITNAMSVVDTLRAAH
jgi:S1-C subfamily serine protease